MVEHVSKEGQGSIPVERESHNFGRRDVAVLSAKAERPKTDVPTFFAQGYGGGSTATHYLESFARAGRNAIGVVNTEAPPQNKKEIREAQRLVPVKVGDVTVEASQLEVDRSKDIIAALEAKGIQKTNAVAESEGALSMMLAVAQRPDLFDNIELVHPAGMDDKKSKATHARVFYNYTLGQLHPRTFMEKLRRRKEKQGIQDEKVPKENRRWKRALQKTVGHSRFHELIPALKEENPHLSFSIVAERDDRIFTPKRLRQVHGVNDEGKSNNLSEFYTSKWGAHGIGYRQERVNEMVGVLDRMEEKKLSQ